MASLRPLIRFVLLLAAAVAPAAAQDAPAPDDALIRTVLEQSSREDVSFRSLVESVTGHRVLPLDRAAETDRAILDAVGVALDKALALLNAPDSPVKQERRINEASRHFEVALERFLNEHPDFECSVPVTANGTRLASGYPDRRLLHRPSGRITYLDPKLVEAGSLGSTLRTFYFTPRTETNKIRDDAHHLLAGILHDGRTGDWSFLGWKLVDLHGFQVRLKAEYQASNKDLYREDLILRSSP